MNSDIDSYKVLLDHVDVGIFQCDTLGRFIYANPYCLTLLQLDSTTFLGSNTVTPFIPDMIELQTALWLEQVQKCQNFHFDLDTTHKSLQIAALPLHNESQTWVGYIGSIQDISQYKALENQIAVSIKQRKSLIEASRTPYLERESNDYISYINPAFTSVFGYTQDDLQSADDWYMKAYPDEVYRENQKSKWLDYLKHFDEYSKISTVEAKIACKDGSLKNVLVSPNKLEGGEDRFSVNFYDITELKRAKASLEKSQERFSLAVSGSGVGIWDWNIETGHVYFSHEFKQELGFSDNEFTNHVDTFFAHLHPNDVSKVQRAFNNHISSEQAPYNTKYRMRHKDGSYHWYRGAGQALRNETGQTYRMAGSHTNITQQMENHDKLKIAKMVFDHSGEAIVYSSKKGIMKAINQAFESITGFSSADIINKPASILLNSHNDANLLNIINNQLKVVGHWSGELWCNHALLDKIAINITINTIKNKKGVIQEYIGLFTDITEKKQTQEIIWKQAHYDSLTQLLNRDSFTKFINSALDSEHPFALLFIDLDHFKHVNDTLGHNMGDELLKQAAHRIQHCVRASDIVSRFGGDEFTVVLSGLISDNIIKRICSQIIHSISSPFDIKKEIIYISASIGITQYPQDSTVVDELYKFADQAMYEAKRSGRNQFSFFTQKLQDTALAQREMSSDLRLALKNNELYILYQPIVDLNDNQIYKAEALLRWQHPIRGLVSPTDFIPIAEETGMINEIGDWVFKQAALQAKIWRKSHQKDFQISINKSPVQLYNSNEFDYRYWSEFLKTINLSGDAIAVEITEGVLLENSDIVHEKLVDFQKNNISISLDDFGTGYSALSYLKKFNINYIKIDRSFVMNLETDKYNLILCETIISMSHKLGMKVIAEGIETQAQKDILIKAGCDYGQGYLFSKPITSDALSHILKKQLD